MKFLIGLCLVIALLGTWANSPDGDAAERTVITTGFYTLAGGVIVNSVCAIIVRGVRAVESGEEMGACSPYGLAGAGISTRLHLYWINGYGPEEWAYVRSVPSRSVDYVKRGVDGVLRVGGEETEGGREVIKEQIDDL